MLLISSPNKGLHSRITFLKENVGRLVSADKHLESNTYSWEDPEPSSIEFEKEFHKLMQDAFENDSRRIVIVIDNLDRLEPHDAIRLWSTLQMFVNNNSAFSESTWIESLYLIIPYDDRTNEESFRTNTDITSQSARTNEAVLDPELSRRFSAARIDKSISIKFYVPCILLPDWRKYFIDQLKKAFPKTDTSTYYSISLLLTIARGKQSSIPTPRGLKIIVNQIGALHIQWNETIPLIQLAYFVILQRWSKNPIEVDLLAGRIPDRRFSTLLGQDASKNLAALLFGCDPNQANHFLLDEPIRTAIETQNYEALYRISKSHSGFAAILDYTVSNQIERWKTSSSEILLTLLYFLEMLAENKRISRSTERQLKISIINAFIDSPIPITGKENHENGLNILLRVSSRNERLFLNVYNSLQKSVAAIENYDEYGGARIVAETVLRALLALNEIQDAARQQLVAWKVPGSFDDFCSFTQHLSTEFKEDQIAGFLAMENEIDIAAQLDQLIANGATEEFHFQAARILSIQGNITEGELIQRALRALEPQNISNASQIEAASSTLLHTGDKGHSALLNCVNSGLLAHQTSVSQVRSNNHSLALIMAIHFSLCPSLKVDTLIYHTGANRQRKVGSSAEGMETIMNLAEEPNDELIDCFKSVLRRYPQLLDAFKVLSTNPQLSKLVCVSIDSIAHEADLWNSIDSYTLARYWSFFDDIGASNLSSMVQATPHIAKNVQEWGFEEELIPFYLLVLNVKRDKKRFVEWLSDSLADLESESWEEDLRSEGIGVVDLAYSIAQDFGKHPWAGKLRLGIEARVRSIMTGVITAPSMKIDSAIACLSSSQKYVLRNSLAEVLFESNDSARKLLITEFGNEILASKIFCQDPKIVTAILEPAIIERKIFLISWIRSAIESAKLIINGTRPLLSSGIDRVYRSQFFRR